MPEIHKHKILLVDDDESVLILLRRLLKSKGFSTIVSALNTIQAIRLIKESEEPFFLIIADQRMPGMKGSEFLEECVTLTPDSRRMLMTAYSNTPSLIEGINKGNIQKFIVKPWDNKNLLKRILEELKVYERSLEKKNLHKTINYQNTQYFKLARELKYRNREFKQEISEKTDELTSLNTTLEQVKATKRFKEAGIETLLSRKIPINKKTLIQAFKIIKEEADSFFMDLAKNNNLSLPHGLKQQKVDAHKPDTMDTIHLFEIIDLLLDQAKKNAAPSLSALGSAFISETGIDNYEKKADLADMAYQEGLLTLEQLEQVRQRQDNFVNEQEKGDITKLLRTTGFISRVELSRLSMKKEFMETRQKDKDFAKDLIQRQLVSKKNVEQALITQLNTFLEKSKCIILGDILVEENLLAPDLRDEVLADYDRLDQKKTKKEIELDSELPLETHIPTPVIRVSDDKIKAYIRFPLRDKKLYELKIIKRLLRDHNIRYGIVGDSLINGFLRSTSDPDKEFLIAWGREPKQGEDARIIYHFDTQQKRPGVVTENGTIDFRDRGDISFSEKGDLLAEKIPFKTEIAGCNVFGQYIPAPKAKDSPLRSGEGTVLSENRLKLYANIRGQPKIHLDTSVCVFKELYINGDVDYDTGHVTFDGNVTVKGIVKHGFVVKCIDLTAYGITGGEIEASGDVNVSTGIVDSRIMAKGNVQAKFVNDSKIEALGNIYVMREIMESEIVVNGELFNLKGRITQSTLIAKKGFTLWEVGTKRAIKSTLKAGLDTYARRLISFHDDEIARRHETLDQIKGAKKKHDDQNFEFHRRIVENSQDQEKIKKKEDALRSRLSSREADSPEKLEIQLEIKEIELAKENIDKEIKQIFEQQDILFKEIETCEKKINNINSELEKLSTQKLSIIEATQSSVSVPVVNIGKSICEGTIIIGTGSSMIVKHELGPCKILEIESSSPDHREEKLMVVQNL